LEFLPHGHVCLRDDPAIIWFLVISNLVIAASYIWIPLGLFNFASDLQLYSKQHRSIVVSSAAFVFACSLTHLADILTLYHPWYWFAGAIDAACALISLYTAFSLAPYLRSAIAAFKENVTLRRAIQSQTTRILNAIDRERVDRILDEEERDING